MYVSMYVWEIVVRTADGDMEIDDRCISMSLHGRMALEEYPKNELFHTPSE